MTLKQTTEPSSYETVVGKITERVELTDGFCLKRRQSLGLSEWLRWLRLSSRVPVYLIRRKETRLWTICASVEITKAKQLPPELPNISGEFLTESLHTDNAISPATSTAQRCAWWKPEIIMVLARGSSAEDFKALNHNCSRLFNASTQIPFSVVLPLKLSLGPAAPGQLHRNKRDLTLWPLLGRARRTAEDLSWFELEKKKASFSSFVVYHYGIRRMENYSIILSMERWSRRQTSELLTMKLKRWSGSTSRRSLRTSAKTSTR